MNNNKGFTLIELLVTIMLLAIIAGIGTYSIVNLVNATKKENYDLLVNNIKSASEAYYQECKYGDTITCNTNGNTTLGQLLNYGFITGNSTDADGNQKLVNPNNDADISSCQINIAYTDGKIVVTNRSTSNSNCPSSY